MSKHFKPLLLLLLIIGALFVMCSCEEEALDITGVGFSNADFIYDGTEKVLLAEGIPEGVTAEYSGNRATDAGSYTATVTLSGNGYKTTTLTATMTISKAQLSGISLSADEAVKSDGAFHLPTLLGAIPSDATLEWYFNDTLSNNGVRAIGDYTVKVIINSKNYNSLELTGSFSIKLDVLNFAKNLVNAFGKTPNAWEFLPDSFKMDNLVIDSANIPTYTDFTEVSSIPKCYIGKQMNVVFGLLDKCDSALVYVDKVQAVMNTIEQAYQTFLNKSPDGYKSFSGEAGGFSYLISVSDEYYILKAEIGSIIVELYSNLATKAYGARVQIASGNTIKYEISEGQLKIATNVLNSASVMVEFVRDTENTAITSGYVYEYLTVAGKEIVGTSAYLHVGQSYTTVIGTKGDFIPTADARNCEVYDNATGALVGTEVSEVLGEDGKRAFDTLWVNLYDVDGITSIKKEDKANKLNPDTVYLNGDSDSMHSKIVSLLNPSRRFDIEFKTVCAYTYNSADDTYTLVEFEVPMLFIQENQLATFEDDFSGVNFDVTLSVSDDDFSAVTYGYHTLLNVYNTIKNKVTQQHIIDYCNSSII